MDYYVPKNVPSGVIGYLTNTKIKGQGSITTYQSPKNWIASEQIRTGHDLNPWLLSFGYDITKDKEGIPVSRPSMKQRKTRMLRRTQKQRKTNSKKRKV